MDNESKTRETTKDEADNRKLLLVSFTYSAMLDVNGHAGEPGMTNAMFVLDATNLTTEEAGTVAGLRLKNGLLVLVKTLDERMAAYNKEHPLPEVPVEEASAPDAPTTEFQA